MHFKKISVSNFGKLSSFEITPSKGLNVIYAPNESGKTTLFSFVKYMLYGTKQKKQTGDISFKEKYMPWNGMPMDGSAELCANDTDYSVSRTDGGKNSKLTVFDISNASNVSECKIPGKYFFGFGENAFDATCFVKDVLYTSAKGASGELMSHLLDNGSEDRLYCRVRKEIEENILELSSEKRKNARIPALESKITKVSGELYSVNSRINALEQKLSEICLVQKTLEQKVAERAEHDSRLRNDEQGRLQNEKEKLLCERQSLEERLSASEKEGKQTSAVHYGAIFACSLAALVVCGFMSLYIKGLLFALPLFLVLIFISLHKIINRKYVVQSHTEQTALLKKQLEYIDLSIDSISKKMSENGVFNQANNTLYTKNFTNGNINDIITWNGSEIAQAESCSRDIQKYSDEKSSLVAEEGLLQKELERLKAKKGKLTQDLRVNELAIQILDSAMNSAKSDLFPKIRKTTAQMYSFLTGDDKTEISVGNEFEVFVAKEGNFRDYRTLSKGSADALYFSLRLALVEVMSGGDTNLPIFIDDSFANLDDERCARVLNIIYKISQRHQVFLCTCRSREGEYFKNKDDVSIFAIQKG